jgi:two-component system cell cycle response regulator
MLEGIEVVELSEIDLDFSIEEMFQQGAPRTLEATTTELASPEELAALDLFRGLANGDLGVLAAHCQSIQAIPGYVLLAPGRLNTRIYSVVEGQLRLYAPTGEKRPLALVDVGHSTGLQSALSVQPVEHAVIATEISNIISIDVATLEEFSKRHHAFALNYMALLASYVRGDNCLRVGANAPGGATRQGYVDELTLLHNQHWLNTMLPRLVARFRMVDKPLALVVLAVDKLDQLVKEHGIGAGLRVLEAVGHWALDQTRPVDILAVDKNRYIYAFLPDCDLDAARHLAGRLKNLIAQLQIPLALENTRPIGVTLSFGIATLEKRMREADLMRQAEALIRNAIGLGGNQLVDSL